MKSVKKMLMGIALILFAIAVAFGGSIFIFIGWLIGLIGLIMTFIGYYFTEDDTD